MRPAKNWILEPRLDAAARISRETGLHHEVCSILVRRGLSDAAAITRFLEPSLDFLESPYAFGGMRKAVDRLRRAASHGEKVLVYGDYDVDGITGSAILYPILRKVGIDTDVHIPHRMNEGYGLNRASLEKLLEKGYRVVVTVDNGITGVSQIEYLAGRGVDVIVVDHHTPKEGLPPAYCIVSAAAGDGKGDPNLAACGLAFKLGWALLGDFREVAEYLDLVALGTVADLAPVTGDNRILLKHGLPVLSKTKRPGLRALMTVARVGREATYRDIAFGLGPRINASGRMGSPEHAFRLLTTTDDAEAFELARFLDAGNRDRQKAELAAFEDAAGRVAEEGAGSVIVVESEAWHEGVLGIVASRLVERFHKPAIVISLKDGIGKGSGRSTPSFSIFESVLECESLLVNFGGHAQACGLTIRAEDVSEFRRKLGEAASRRASLGLASDLHIEAELPPAAIDLRFLKELERLAPFGPGNRKPLFLSRGMRVKGDVRKRGKDTLQCWMTDGEGSLTCEAVGFRMYERWKESSKRSLDVVYQPTLVQWNGIASIQLELEDWR